MSTSTNKTQEDILNTQTSAEEIHNDNSPLITHKKVEETPFYITGNNETGYFVRMGDYRLTEIHKTEEEAATELKTNYWHIIIRIVGAIIERYLSDKKP